MNQNNNENHDASDSAFFGTVKRSIRKLLLLISPLFRKQVEMNEQLVSMQVMQQQLFTELSQRIDNMSEGLDHYKGNMWIFANSMYSYCMNEIVKRQDVIEESKDYQYHKTLHTVLKIHDVKDGEKCRVGRGYDGGYVMVRPFSTSQIAYSFGISDDVSWDLEMAGHGYTVFQYDHTIESLPEEHTAFRWSKTGLTGEEETDMLKHFDTLIHENGHEDETGMLLKMDIEGHEWSVLNKVSGDLLNQFDQITMEVHDLTNTADAEYKISALEKLTANHAVVHVHGNNNMQMVFCDNMITPDVLELTLLKRDKYCLTESMTVFPEVIDQPNNDTKTDILLGRW